jgi:hypothetical protein
VTTSAQRKKARIREEHKVKQPWSSTQEAEAEGLRVLGQPGIHNKTLSQTLLLSKITQKYKIKKKKK